MRLYVTAQPAVIRSPSGTHWVKRSRPTDYLAASRSRPAFLAASLFGARLSESNTRERVAEVVRQMSGR